MEFVLADGKHLNPLCSTLVMPALSIGNVGQLAVDLLISSTQAERVGYLDDPSVLPCVGNNAYVPFPEGDLSLPLEVYELPSQAVSLMQQRSPVTKIYLEGSLKTICNLISRSSFSQSIQIHGHPSVHGLHGMIIEFARNLTKFSITTGKKHVVILSSLDSGRRKIIDPLSDMQMYYISSSDEVDDDCEKLGWKRFDEYDPSHGRWKLLNSLADGSAVQEVSFEEEDYTDEDYFPSLPFAALFSCFKAKGLKVTCLLCYCSEGDNIPDSFKLADSACKLLGLTPGNERDGWIIPFSWRSVYGPPPDMTLF